MNLTAEEMTDTLLLTSLPNLLVTALRTVNQHGEEHKISEEAAWLLSHDIILGCYPGLQALPCTEMTPFELANEILEAARKQGGF